MAMAPNLLLYGFYVSVFMSVVLFAYGIWRLQDARRMGMSALRRRLRDRATPQADGSSPGSLRLDSGARTALLQHVALALDRTGLSYSAHKVLGGFAGLAMAAIFAAAMLAILSEGLSWLLPAFALVGGIGLAAAYLRFRKASRLARFAAQLPDALDVMVRSLRAGHPVAVAMSMVASDLPDPIAGEFSKAVNEMTYGLDLRQALSHLADRVDVQDLRFAVATVGLQHETGGNLAEVLQGLADLMRVRARLTRKVRAFTAEARLSARILAVMPLIFVGLIFWANPEIYLGAARDPMFFPVLFAAGGLQVFGILVMGRMARIRV
jgi:tight adherence protein B